MWAAASSLHFQPLKPWPSNTTPLRRRSMVGNNSTTNREEKTGGVDLVLARAALKSNGPQQNIDAKTKTIPKGADVLKALERATAQKAKRKKEKKIETRAVSTITDRQGAPCNFVDVRPLCIKLEWGDRLVELEMRLQQLAHRFTSMHGKMMNKEKEIETISKYFE